MGRETGTGEAISLNIGVLSGKGGTGKTLVTTNLAVLMGYNYVDCDVEEPNGFIFLKPESEESEVVEVDNPSIDLEKCSLCGKCVESCNFNALARTKQIVLFEKLCHSCGVCQMTCPEGAISYGKREIGKIVRGERFGIDCIEGELSVGEAMAVPVISRVLSSLSDKSINLVDCAPGTSCNVVGTLEHMDKAILVTEPTRFGLHDLERAVELCRRRGIPFAVIINRCGAEANIIDSYCEQNHLKIIGRIPYDRKIAEIYSRGSLILDDNRFKKLFDEIAEEIRGL